MIKLSKGLTGLFDIIPTIGFESLSLQKKHFLTLETLHYYHRDPFDRILIAQAISEDLTIISSDEAFHNYSVKILW